MLYFRRSHALYLFLTAVLLTALGAQGRAQDTGRRYYDMGAPAYTDLWVDPVRGSDDNSGTTRAAAFRTIAQAWYQIPVETPLARAYRILLVGGDYPESSLPSANWMELRYGSFAHPVRIEAADGPRTARIHAYLQFDHCTYLYLVGLDFVTDRGYGGGANVLHFSSCDHIVLRGVRMDGFDGVVNEPQETLKVNQVQYMYVEDCDINGAFWFGLDYVGVQYGHIQGNKIHNTENDALLVKGGSAYLRIEGNEVYNSAGIGLAAGQGTTFGFMVSPWLHYEVYDCKFINNIVHDVQNAGVAVRGGYNILVAHNTFYRVAYDENGAGLILCSPGGRVCQGDLPICQAYHNAGGWGQTTLGEEAECIPNKNVYIYNNIFYNPAGTQTRYGHLTIFGPMTPPAGANIPNPLLSDDNLQIRGNLIWNGPADLPIGLDETSGCQPSNPTCNAALLYAQNAINTVQPQLTDPAHGNYRPLPGGTVFRFAARPIPNFSGTDRQPHPLAPLGNLTNVVLRDFTGRAQTWMRCPGAYARVPSDLNLDGKSDFVWQNRSTGRVACWLMNGTTLARSGTIGDVVPTDGKLLLAPDLNGDGKPDLLLQNQVTGQVSCRLMNGRDILGVRTIGAPVGASWKVVAALDLNQDGKTDLLWRNLSTGRVCYWLLNETNLAASAYIGGAVSASWRLVTTPDLNGDGRPDLLWQNESTGQVSYWLLNGTVLLGTGTIGPAPGAAWKLVQAVDLNDDGQMDFLWQNRVTGQVAYWIINGTRQAGYGYIGGDLRPGGPLLLASDLDGDGKPDLLWQNPLTGAVGYWRLNGTTVAGAGTVLASGTADWSFVNSY